MCIVVITMYQEEKRLKITKENLMIDPCFRTWLPYINSGTPFGGGLDMLFRPVAFLTLILFPAHIAINYEFVMYIFLAGLFMYFYIKAK